MNNSKVSVEIKYLNDSVENFIMDVNSYGSELFQKIVMKLNLIESYFFGLEYISVNKDVCWVDMRKPLVKQITHRNKYIYQFCVKFYTPDPNMLHDTLTKQLFIMQLKKDIENGDLICCESTKILLGGLFLQLYYPNIDVTQSSQHDLIHSFLASLFANSLQNPNANNSTSLSSNCSSNHLSSTSSSTYLDRIIGQCLDFKNTLKDQGVSETEYQLLEILRKVEFYGMKLHPANDSEGLSINLAVYHMGIVIFQKSTKVNTFNWSKIRKLSFKRKRFLIKLHPEEYLELFVLWVVQGFFKDTLEFYFDSRNGCKNFWKKCIEHHTFFRTQKSRPIYSTMERHSSKLTSFRRNFNGSKFRYVGLTQFEVEQLNMNRNSLDAQIERSVSARQLYSPNLSLDNHFTKRTNSLQRTHNHLTTIHNNNATTSTNSSNTQSSTAPPVEALSLTWQRHANKTHKHTNNILPIRSQSQVDGQSNSQSPGNPINIAIRHCPNFIDDNCLSNEATKRVLVALQNTYQSMKPSSSWNQLRSNDFNKITDSEGHRHSNLDVTDFSKKLSLMKQNSTTNELPCSPNNSLEPSGKRTMSLSSSLSIKSSQQINNNNIITQPITTSSQQLSPHNILLNKQQHHQNNIPLYSTTTSSSTASSSVLLTHSHNKQQYQTTLDNSFHRQQHLNNIPLISSTPSSSVVLTHSCSHNEQQHQTTLDNSLQQQQNNIAGNNCDFDEFAGFFPELLRDMHKSSLNNQYSDKIPLVITTNISSESISFDCLLKSLEKDFLFNEFSYVKELKMLNEVLSKFDCDSTDKEVHNDKYPHSRFILGSIFTLFKQMYHQTNVYLNQLEELIQTNSKSLTNSQHHIDKFIEILCNYAKFIEVPSQQYINEIISLLSKLHVNMPISSPVPSISPANKSAINTASSTQQINQEIQHLNCNNPQLFRLFLCPVIRQQFQRNCLTSFLYAKYQYSRIKELNATNSFEEFCLNKSPNNICNISVTCSSVPVSHITDSLQFMMLLSNIDLSTDPCITSNKTHQVNLPIRFGWVQKLTNKGTSKRLLILFPYQMYLISRKNTSHNSSSSRFIMDSNWSTNEIKSCELVSKTSTTTPTTSSNNINGYQCDSPLQSAFTIVLSNNNREIVLLADCVKSAQIWTNKIQALHTSSLDDCTDQADKSSDIIQPIESSVQWDFALFDMCYHEKISMNWTDVRFWFEYRYSSYLLRKCNSNSNWQRLWVELANYQLIFYRSHSHIQSVASLSLIGAKLTSHNTLTTNSSNNNNSSMKLWIFSIHKESKENLFRAENCYFYNRWISCIERVCSMC